MKCYVGVGTNLGDRRSNLETAARALQRFSIGGTELRTSPVYQTPAMVPPGAPADWRIPFLNAVIELETASSPRELLVALKRIEKEMGRVESERWAPRLIDLDLLLYGNEVVEEADLIVPHPGAWDRSFVLDPLRDLDPGLRLPLKSETVLSRARAHPGRAPLWMGILNLTPDSFSDGGALEGLSAIERKIGAYEEEGVQILDLGAESTRPGATEISPEEEWRRLLPALELSKARYAGKLFRPVVSVDTRHALVAARALAMGVDWINDVSGLSDPAMAGVLREHRCTYVLMHSLTVPASKDVVLPKHVDPVETVKAWALEKLEVLDRLGVSRERVVFDPGIGFGKTPHQSLEILKRLEELFELPVRVLVGHSRKSFMSMWGPRPAAERDWESVGVSLQMAERGAEIIRVHEAHLHLRAHRAFQEVSAWSV